MLCSYWFPDQVCLLKMAVKWPVCFCLFACHPFSDFGFSRLEIMQVHNPILNIQISSVPGDE